jgi:hypothetical protein
MGHAHKQKTTVVIQQGSSCARGTHIADKTMADSLSSSKYQSVLSLLRRQKWLESQKETATITNSTHNHASGTIPVDAGHPCFPANN